MDKGSERLGDQLQRVVATGLTKSEAKRAICVGIRAGQIQVWLQIEKIYPEKENFVHRRRFRSGDLKYLFPHEIDWEKSLFIGRLQKITDSSPLFRLKWIELCNEGVRQLCNEISWRQAGIVEGTVADLYNLADLTTEEPASRSDRQEAPHGDAPAQHALDLMGDAGASIAQGNLHDASQSSRRTAAAKSGATRALASQLRDNPDLKRADAKNWCATAGYQLSARGFQSRVWPEARTLAGLPAIGSPGRKRKKT